MHLSILYYSQPKIGIFVTILFLILEGEKLKIRLGNRDIWIQHTQIMLKNMVPHFYQKMLVLITFITNVPSLIVHNMMSIGLLDFEL